jgi:hypothetical protein
MPLTQLLATCDKLLLHSSLTGGIGPSRENEYVRMGGHEQPEDALQQVPPLLRLLGLHLILGAAIGVAFVSLILLGNVAGLKKLIVEAQNPLLPLLLLYTFNVLTFSSVTMGIGIMTMPLVGSERALEPDSDVDLLEHIADGNRDWRDLP